jgi:hypothetical protein
LGAQILNVHDLSKSLNYLSSNVLSCTSLYIVKVILNNPKIILYNIAFSRGRAPNNPVMNYTRVQYFLSQKITYVLASDILLVKISSKSNKNWAWNVLKNCGYIIPVWNIEKKCKTTFNSVFVGKKIIKIEQESTLE